MKKIAAPPPDFTDNAQALTVSDPRALLRQMAEGLEDIATPKERMDYMARQWRSHEHKI